MSSRESKKLQKLLIVIQLHEKINLEKEDNFVDLKGIDARFIIIPKTNFKKIDHLSVEMDEESQKYAGSFKELENWAVSLVSFIKDGNTRQNFYFHSLLENKTQFDNVPSSNNFFIRNVNY